MEDAGAAAITMYSLFEEQIDIEALAQHHFIEQTTFMLRRGDGLLPEGGRLQPRPGRLSGPDPAGQRRRGRAGHRQPERRDHRRLDRVRPADRGGRRRRAGAERLPDPDAARPDQRSSVEKIYLEILRDVKASVRIPVAMKLSPFFSAMPNMAHRLDEAGADALVLFNRFYQPDFDLEELTVTPNLVLSTLVGDAAAAALDRHPLRPRQGLAGAHHRRPHGRGCGQGGHGRRRHRQRGLGAAGARARQDRRADRRR